VDDGPEGPLFLSERCYRNLFALFNGPECVIDMAYFTNLPNSYSGFHQQFGDYLVDLRSIGKKAVASVIRRRISSIKFRDFRTRKQKKLPAAALFLGYSI
jgi:hypothetical protein